MKILSSEAVVRLEGRDIVRPKTRYVMPNEMAWELTHNIKDVEWKISAVDCYERRYAGQDLNGKSLCIVRYHGIGDMLMVTALPHYLKHLYPDATINVYSNESYASSVWDGNESLSVRTALSLPLTLDAVRQYDYHLFFDGMIECNAERDQGNAYDDMFAFAGMTDVPAAQKVPHLYRRDTDSEWVDAKHINLDEPYYVYCMHASAPQRTYPTAQSKEVIERLLEEHKDYKVYVMSEVGEPIVLHERCVWVGRLKTWRHAIPLIRGARAVITPDSGFGHVAACFPNVPVVSLWASFSYESRAKHYPNHHPLTAYGACGSAPCWQHGGALPVGKCKMCAAYVGDDGYCAALSTITPERIVEAVNAYGK